MHITKQELVSLVKQGYAELEERMHSENPSKLFAEYFKNLEDMKQISLSWDFTMRDIYELNSVLCNEIRLTTKEYQLEDAFELAKACIAHKLI